MKEKEERKQDEKPNAIQIISHIISCIAFGISIVVLLKTMY